MARLAIASILVFAALPSLFAQQSGMSRGLSAPAPAVKEGPAPGESRVRLLHKDPAAGLELWQTWLGPFWIPPPGQELLEFLQWEQVVQKVYSHPLVQVRSGDVVIDCGAHVGVFARLALQRGARLVVAVEPERLNRLALEKNFSAELRLGRVKLVSQGVWDTVGKLPLRVSGVNTGSHSLVSDNDIRGVEIIEVTTIDALVEAARLPRVDFIKMDIEGAERHALRGARQVLQRWRPRLAISSYHLKDDPSVIAGIVWSVRPDYHIASKDLEKPQHGTVVPKVLFFH